MTASTDPAETFRQEARDLLDTLEQTLLDLDRDTGNRDLVDTAFRALHTIKGSGAMFGHDAVAVFVHDFETAFDRVRKGSAAITPELVEVALQAKDHIADLVEDPRGHAAASAAILDNLRAIVGAPAGEGDAPAPDASTQAQADDATQGVVVRFWLPETAIAFGTDPLLLLDELRDLGATEVRGLLDRLPPLAEMDPGATYLGWEATFAAGVSAGDIEDVFMFVRDGTELSITPATHEGTAAPSPEPPPPEDPQAAALPAVRGGAVTQMPAAGAASSLRVPAERLDELMDRVGELVIAQSRLSQIAVASADLNLKAVAEELDRLSSGLRDTTMGIRMVPIGSLFSRFRRLVHDLSADMGKEIDFVTLGEDTELDKTMIERLADPLVHLIRNAIDHGVEDPDTRRAAGKPAAGQIRLTAVHKGSEVAITISDDGAGLDAGRIRAKAEKSGLVAPGAVMDDAAIFQLIFQPGFSTARKVTAVSGRGVGMDVVKRGIEGLRGLIDLTSTPGAGTAVTLRLPLTLAIIESMLVQVGAGRYAIPLSSVEECAALPDSCRSGDHGRNFLNIRGGLVPFLRLRDQFGVTDDPSPYPKIVIVSTGDDRVGLVVDHIIGNGQTVIKSLSKLHADVDTFSGATILGDGTVALILDVAALVKAAQDMELGASGTRLGRVA